MSNDHSDHLTGIRSDLNSEDTRALKRMRGSIVVKAVLIVFVAGYMSWIMSSVAKLDARELTRIAAISFEEHVPEWRKEMQNYAIAAAPGLTDQARDLLLALPTQLRVHLEQRLLAATDHALTRFETNVTAAIETILDDQLTAMRAAVPGTTSEEQLDLMVMGVSGLFRDTMTEAIDVFYLDYSAEVHRLNSHLDRLARARDLTEAERIDKQLIEAWITLVEHHAIIDAGGMLASLDR